MDASARQRRLAQLDRQLGTAGRSVLEPMGFALGAHRAFRRFQPSDHGTVVHIVHCQIGSKSLAGRFTINLAVCHSTFTPDACTEPVDEVVTGYVALRTRVAMLAPPPRSFVDRLLRRTPEPRDRWWPMSENAAKTAAALGEALALVRATAPAWFETHGTEAACRAVHERAQASARVT